MKKWIVLGSLVVSLITNALALHLKQEIIEAKTIQDIQDALALIKDGAIVFLDVDDTLITPKSKIFRATSSYRSLIDDLKKNRDKFPNFETILSHWRLQRKVILTSEEWPVLIKELKEKFPVYALTKMDSGPMGDIPSMEEWRYKELFEKKISFTSSYQGAFQKILLSASSKGSPGIFYRGIFITGSFGKGDLIHAVIEDLHPSQIVLVDDGPEHLQDALEKCAQSSVSFLGIFFKGAELIPGTPNPKVAELQKQTLFEKGEWLEDEEAEQLLANGGES